jgi:hypothetical protein
MKVGLTKEGPDMDSEVEIIALEFTLHHPSFGTQELQMFPCKHTVKKMYGGQYEAIITLHTSAGDRQVRSWVYF